MEKKVPIAGIPASFKAFRAMQYTDEPAERVPELLRYDSPSPCPPRGHSPCSPRLRLYTFQRLQNVGSRMRKPPHWTSEGWVTCTPPHYPAIDPHPRNVL